MLSFYIEYNKWLELGAETESFSRSCGLCANLYDFAETFAIDPDILLEEMHDQFYYAGLDNSLPFNEDFGCYLMEGGGEACFNNPLRVQWVKDRIAEQTTEGEKNA